MNRLVIKQNTVTENVTSELISKLYTNAKEIKDYEELNEIEDSLIELLGNLLVVHAYEDEVTYLETKFSPNLNINVTGGTYIKFEQPYVALILMEHNLVQNDGIGITKSAMQAVTAFALDYWFINNAYITKFNELKYFTNLHVLNAAFYGCTGLEEIDLRHATSLPSSAFLQCSNLKTVGNTVNLQSVGNGAFLSCVKLELINLSNATTIGTESFNWCTALTTIDLSSCTSLGNAAFLNCTSLTTVTLNPLLTSIGRNAFQGCTSLTSVDLSSCTSIGQQAFNGCTALQSISLDNCTLLGRSSFAGCLNLDITDWDLSSVTTLGLYSFYGCAKLKGTLNLSGLLTVDVLTTQLFYGCSSLQKIILGHMPSVSTSRVNVNKSTFYQCNSLKVVDINQLDGIIFSNAILIDNNVFLAFIIRNTDSIPTITLDLGTSTALWSKFTSSSNAKIYVTDALYSTYINHADWSDLASHIEPLSNYVAS